MSVQKPIPQSKSPQNAGQSSRQKTDKLWISAALVAVLMGFGATGAFANDGLLGGVGNTLNGVTSNLTGTVNDLESSANAGSGSISLVSASDVNATSGDHSADLNTNVNASAQRAEGLNLSGVAGNATKASVNLSDTHQATSAHVSSNGSIILGD